MKRHLLPGSIRGERHGADPHGERARGCTFELDTARGQWHAEKVGETLTVSNWSWTGSPTDYSYQWQRCTSSTSCTSVADATENTYIARNADVGYTLRAVVTATNADGLSTANSNQTAAITAATGVPVNTVRPSISGDAIVGERADGRERHLDEWPDLVPLPVAAMRPIRRRVCPDRIRRAKLLTTPRRRRRHDACPRDGTQRERFRHRPLGASDVVQPLPVAAAPKDKAPTISLALDSSASAYALRPLPRV